MMKTFSESLSPVTLAAISRPGVPCRCAARHRRSARHPGRYQDRTVSVNGVVTSSGASAVPFGFYKVDDGNREGTVLSEGPACRRREERSGVKGRVEQVAQFVAAARPPSQRARILRQALTVVPAAQAAASAASAEYWCRARDGSSIGAPLLFT